MILKMKISQKERTHFARIILLFLSVTLLLVALTYGEEVSTRKSSEEEVKVEVERGPSLVERAIGITSGLNSRWDKIKTWAKMGWMNFQPPDAGFGQSGSSADVVKEAASRSFETSKETVEQAAESAAKAAGDAMEKTKEKLKRTVSGGDPDAEL